MTEAEFTEHYGLPWEMWWNLTPMQRFEYSQKILWPKYLALGGSLEPESNDQDSSPQC
jgi:hypothetical protein